MSLQKKKSSPQRPSLVQRFLGSVANWLRGRFAKKAERKKRRRRIMIRTAFASILVGLGFFSYLTNPFVHFSIVVDPYTQIEREGGSFELTASDAIILQDDAFFGWIAQAKAGWHILASYFTGGPKASQASVDEIIREIHAARFDPENPFLISGDHFSVLYPRSLGIFYYSILDPRTALDETDWQNRQHIYLKTTAYALMVYDQADRLSTTIVPVGPRSVALMNIYAYPSDTLYSILHALEVMQNDNALPEVYPFEVVEDDLSLASATTSADLNLALPTARQPLSETGWYQLETATAAAELLENHRPALVRHYQTYLRDMVDPATGLVREDKWTSGTKDIVKRRSSFYDNVVVWKTKQQAMELGLIEDNPAELAALKQKILTQFWLEPEGYFLDQLDPRAVEEKHYSSDWLIAYMTEFLDPQKPEDLRMLQRTVSYIQRNAIDQPFGLQFQADRRDYQLHGVVKYTAPTYGSTAIWSNWGTEYIKLLTHLALETGDQTYLDQADRQLAAYTFNIKRYRGYPEVYDSNGDFFRTPFYKSIRKTGWVVNYEQARDMVEWARVVLSGE